MSKFIPAPILAPVSGSDGPSGKSALTTSLREAWENSLFREMVAETRRFFLRMRAIRNRPSPVHWVKLPSDPTVEGESYLLNRNFVRACNDHIKQQSVHSPWCGPLDQELLGLAFRAGAKWYFDTHMSEGDDLRQP